MNKKDKAINCPNCGYNITDLINQEVAKARLKLENENTLRVSERTQLIDSVKGQLVAMQRKIDHASISQQVSGEAFEILLEEFLRRIYPLDEIKPVPKGKLGADTIQIINTREKSAVGSILYECKRTKSWSNKWIPKFKEDLKQSKCTFGILVSEVLPIDNPQMSLVNGIWICTINEVKALSTVLRETAILCEIATSNGKQNGNAQKVYAYLTSPQFKIEIEAIVESFTELDQQLTKEKHAAHLSFKNREAAIQKAIQSTISLYTSIRAITGAAIEPLESLAEADKSLTA